MKIYTMYDRVVGQYGNPFFAINEADCIRRLGYSQKDNPFFADLDLYYIGDYDIDTGAIVPVEKPVFVSPMQAVIDSAMRNYGSSQGVDTHA